MNYQPVVIIGAPRSGTNMLRDVLAGLPGFETWPCDEINYIWRHGNVRYPNDAIPPERATPPVAGYIRRQFDKLANRTDATVVIEKTCANSLRVPFVDAVVPETKYIRICRDGVDAVASAMKRWKAELDIAYVARKARYVPFSDLPYYATNYALSRMHKLVSRENRLATWGPRIAGMNEWQGRYDLLQTCALQWRACLEDADRDLHTLGNARVFQIRYEDFVAAPRAQLSAMLAFLEHDADAKLIDQVTQVVSPRSVGRGRAQLGEAQLEKILPLINTTLRAYGYGDGSHATLLSPE